MLRETLLASFQALEGRFASALAEAQTMDDQFQRAYQVFQAQMASHLHQAMNTLPANNPLSEQIKHFIHSLQQQDQRWRERLQHRDKGLAFRQGFEDSLLVFVFGKVKSGKSSLGNYMAWGQTDPTQQTKDSLPANQHPTWFSHENTEAENGDAPREAEQNQQFRVDGTEATSSIQGFRLPGLTWVDSPGLHSVKQCNGKLAQEYVQHADLILYTMSSSAPGRASDLQEIRQLLDQKKQTLLLITGSDTPDEDWDDENDRMVIKGKMMKPALTRLAQRDYVAKELNADGIARENVEIISISAQVAQRFFDDEQHMAESGMAQLFATLHTLSHAEGVRIKRHVPLNNFHKFLTVCIDDLAPYHQQIALFGETFKKLQRTLAQTIIRQVRHAQSRMRASVDDTFDALLALRDDESAINSQLRQARTRWETVHQEVVEEAIAELFRDITREFKTAMRDSWQASTLTLPNFSLEKITEEIPGEVVKGNRKRNSRLGALAGAAIGFALGGPAGAAVGMTIGGGAGGALSTGPRMGTRTIELTVGDNLSAIQAQAIERYCASVASAIHALADQLTTQLLTESEALTDALKREVATMSLAIEHLLLETQRILHQENQ